MACSPILWPTIWVISLATAFRRKRDIDIASVASGKSHCRREATRLVSQQTRRIIKDNSQLQMQMLQLSDCLSALSLCVSDPTVCSVSVCLFVCLSLLCLSISALSVSFGWQMKASRNVDNSLAAQKQQKDEGEGATAEAALVRGTAVVSVGGVWQQEASIMCS